MTGAWFDSLGQWDVLWASAMVRASWQGGVALVLVGAACRLWPQMPARVRCGLWRLAYLKLLLGLVWITQIDLPLLPPASSLPPAASTPGAPVFAPAGPAPERQPPASRAPDSSMATPDGVAGLLLLWLLGVGSSIGRGIGAWRQMQQLRRASEPVREPKIIACSTELCCRLGLLDAPPLLAAPGAGSPSLVGLLRPVILLPTPLLTECSLPELRVMLAHELAHLRRRDLAWSWLPALAQGLFWPHPLVWLAGREWCLAQELACDEVAVRVTSTPPGDYGDILLKVAARYGTRTAGGPVTVGVLESYQTLQRRLIAMRSIGQISGRRIACLGAVLGALGVVVLVPWRITAQSPGHTDNEKAGSAAMDREAQARLKKLGMALQFYAQDWSAALPPMKRPAEAQKVLLPYTRDKAVFVDPRTGTPYLANPSLSGKRSGLVLMQFRRRGPGRARWIMTKADITRPAEVVAFYAPCPTPVGERDVLFVDGHVSRVSEAEWEQLRRSSHIPGDTTAGHPRVQGYGSAGSPPAQGYSRVGGPPLPADSAADRPSTSGPGRAAAPPQPGTDGSGAEQRFGFAGVDEFFLLPFPAVQEELRLTAAQKVALGAGLKAWAQQSKVLQQTPPAARQANLQQAEAATRSRLLALLTPAQRQRLNQFVLQVNGAPALLREDVAPVLKLTPEQRQQITRRLQDEAVTEQFLVGQIEGAHTTAKQRDAALRLLPELRQHVYQQVLAVLTPEQRQRWQSLIGPPAALGALIVKG